MLNKETITKRFKSIQDSICERLEQCDGLATFEQDLWERDGGGGGRTRVIQNGNVLEKGGVNFSAVHGKMPAIIAKELGTGDAQFYATGVSIVLHPINPFVPIIHMNIRYFEMSNGVKWFGGGIDLTPHYVVEEDAKYFHEALKEICNKHSKSYYDEFKEWADNYFYITHRNETRGIGGIFFDRLQPTDDYSLQQRFEFVVEVGELFAPLYTTLVNKHRNKPYNEANKAWQHIRRGRYVEFNLVYDRGTKFGLETNGRIESILMSLPTNASWVYNHQVTPDSEEEKTLKLLRKGINWA